jgi:serine/threonine protein kinase
LVAEGVYYLHSNTPPILHRDLKSLNILVDADWNIKVSDFGLTDFKPDVDKPHNLQLGTPFWMAPEAMEHQEFSEASDVYSFGMIIWEMFTRQVPFPNMNPHQVCLCSSSLFLFIIHC